MNSEAPRVLIVRLSAVGDCVLTMPVACALRDRFPRARIAWMVQGGGASLLRGHKALDELIVVPKDVFRSTKSFLGLRKTLRDGKYDVVIESQGLTKSALLGRLSGAPRRIGFTRGPFRGRELSTWLNNELITPTTDHVVDQQLELLQPLGVNDPFVHFDVPRHQVDGDVVDALLKERTAADEYVLIQPGAGWPSKLWPTERYAGVAAWLGKRGLRSIVLWAGDEERRFADEIVAGANGAALAAPPTTLPQVAELARRARFFLGPDTGPLHLAAAVGTPCLGLYGPMPATRCGPYGAKHVVLQNACLEGGTRNRRRADAETMKAISVAEVCGAAERMLSRARAAA